VRKSPGLTLTDGAGGFLPGVPLGCFRIVGLLSHIRPDHAWGPGPLGAIAEQWGRGHVRPVGNLTQESNAGHSRRVPMPCPSEFSRPTCNSLSNASINRPTTKPCGA
jgi:hypothetical protein